MKTKKEKLKRAILYARVAVKAKDLKPDRLIHQLDELQIYCQDHHLKVAGVYYDIASGASFERKEFQNLLKDLKKKRVKADLLLFTKWDRFSRNFLIADNMVNELKGFGIKPMAIREKVGFRSFVSIINEMMNLKWEKH